MAWKPLGKKRRKDDEEGEDLELVEPAPVIRLHFDADEEDEEQDEAPTEAPPRATGRYQPRYAPNPRVIEAELDGMTEFSEGEAGEGVAPERIRHAVDRLAAGEGQVAEDTEKETAKVDRSAAAKKAAETRRKNQEAKEKAAKEAAEKRKKAAEARKRKEAAKKAAETRRKNRLAKEKAEKEAAEARAAAAAARKAGEKEYRPQCGAITADGLQCRNSARKQSKYCASHKGYRPSSLDAALERTDTVPRAKKAEDTLPTKGTIKSKDDLRPQCAAWTSGNKQCRNSARKGSKYCASHKGYNPRSALKRMDTAPRWKKAEDTKPSLRE